MMFCFIIAIAILGYCYQVVLLSCWTFLPFEDIRTILQLANVVAKEKYQRTPNAGKNLAAYLERSPDYNIRIIGQNLPKSNGSKDISAVLNDTKPEKKPAFVGGKYHLNSFKAKYAVSYDELMAVLKAIPMRKDFCCSSHLDRLIGYIWSGLYRKLVTDDCFMTSLKYLFHAPENSQRRAERQLSIDDYKGVFIMLILGYMLSILLFILEVFIDNLKTLTVFS